MDSSAKVKRSGGKKTMYTVRIVGAVLVSQMEGVTALSMRLQL